MIKCPHCGEDLSEVGVIELVGFVEYPDKSGNIPYDNRKSNRLDDTEGYLCGSCSENLDWNDEANHTHIFGEVA